MTATDLEQRAYEAAYAELQVSQEGRRVDAARGVVKMLGGVRLTYGTETLWQLAEPAEIALRAVVLRDWGHPEQLLMAELDAAIQAAAAVLAEGQS